MRTIRILEVPILLLCLGAIALDNGHNVTATILIVISIIRLVVNAITDEFNYKN